MFFINCSLCSIYIFSDDVNTCLIGKSLTMFGTINEQESAIVAHLFGDKKWPGRKIV